ncbi:MAG: hypothetical protein AUG82_01365 [Ktedonobacter sp. 13_1_20CM_4_53_11]|nr:MAG: hypothetical protein AUG82_01365 [Ktedonobacter sp. 13_1_20CM_4_53_11]
MKQELNQSLLLQGSFEMKQSEAHASLDGAKRKLVSFGDLHVRPTVYLFNQSESYCLEQAYSATI